MSATRWPLEQSLLLPVIRQLPPRLIFTPMEDGPPKTRLRDLGAPGAIEGAITFTGPQHSLFLMWGEDILGKWTQPFSIVDPLDGNLRDLQFKVEPKLTQHVGAGSGIDPDRGVWTYALSLAVLS